MLLALAYQPLVLPFLALPVVGAVGSAQRAIRRRLEARTDVLTGLSNRLGGDEFVVLWRDHAPAGEYRARGARVRAALRERLELPEGLIALDGSVGVAVFPHDAGDLRSLLGRADEAMYRAKSAGGGVVLASDEPTAASTLATAGATVE